MPLDVMTKPSVNDGLIRMPIAYANIVVVVVVGYDI